LKNPGGQMMNKKLKISIFFALGIVWFFVSGFKFTGADSKGTISYSLFKIERSKDANQIFYEVNVDANGNLDTSDPFHIYWVKHTQGGKMRPLTWVQKKFAYGLRFDNVSRQEVRFHFVSYVNKDFHVHQDKSGNYSVFTISLNRMVIVKRIFIQIDGGSFWIPEISKVELHSEDPESGEMIVEIIIP
jgi:hypothetical protein